MNPTEHETEETTTPETEVEETVDPETETEPEGEEEETGEPAIDWKAIAEAERKAREKAEGIHAHQRIKGKKEVEADTEDEDEHDDEPKYITERQVQEMLRRDRIETRREVLATRATDIAKGLTDSTDEADAVLAIYNNRVFPEGMSLEKQMQEAYYIAHGPRIAAKRDEYRRTINSKNTATTGSPEAGHRTAATKQPKIAADVQRELTRIGFTWDGKEMTKKLTTGKTLVRDLKTGKNYVR